MKTRTRLLQIYVTLLLAATLLLNLWLLNRAGGAGLGPLLGYSLSRIALLIPVLILTLIIGWLTLRSWRDQLCLDSFGARLGDLLERENLYIILILSGTVVILLGSWVYQIGSVIQDSYFQGYFSKIAPFLLWGIAVAAITLLCE